MLLGERIRILARFLFSSFNVVSCPPAQRAHAQAGARGGYNRGLSIDFGLPTAWTTTRAAIHNHSSKHAAAADTRQQGGADLG